MATVKLRTCDCCYAEIPPRTGAELHQRRITQYESLLATDSARLLDICDGCLAKLPLPEWKYADPINHDAYRKAFLANGKPSPSGK